MKIKLVLCVFVAMVFVPGLSAYTEWDGGDIEGGEYQVSAGVTTYADAGAYIGVPLHIYGTAIFQSGTSDIDGNIIIYPGGKVHALGTLKNLSTSSINISGDFYLYETLQNGDPSNVGTINIHHPGKLYILGGELVDGHASSVTNVNSGGALYNYYGTIDNSTGSPTSLDIKAGGKFHNVRGTRPYAFTVNNGCHLLDDDEINLESDLEIQYTWTFTSNAVINGNGHKIALTGDDGIIKVGRPDISLFLDDVTIDGAGGTRVRCTDNTSTLSLGNTTWLLDSNATFTKGRIFVQGDWNIISDDKNFAYQTDQTSTVSAYASIRFVETTLDYDTGDNKRLIFDDQTATLIIEDGRILATQECKLEYGTLETYGDVTFEGIGDLLMQNLSGILPVGNVTHLGSVSTS